MVIFLGLFMSGNVELNPGPKEGEYHTPDVVDYYCDNSMHASLIMNDTIRVIYAIKNTLDTMNSIV